jgi:hypothetical protein
LFEPKILNTHDLPLNLDVPKLLLKAAGKERELGLQGDLHEF